MGEFLKVQIDLKKDTACSTGWITRHTTGFRETEGNHGYDADFSYRECNGVQTYQYQIGGTKIIKDKFMMSQLIESRYVINNFKFKKHNIQVETLSDTWNKDSWLSIEDLLKHYKIVFFYKTGLGRKVSTRPLSIDPTIYNIYIRKVETSDRAVEEDFFYTSIILEIPITKINNNSTTIEKEMSSRFRSTEAAEAEEAAEAAEAAPGWTSLLKELQRRRLEEAAKNVVMGGKKRKTKKIRKSRMGRFPHKTKTKTKKRRRPTKKRKKTYKKKIKLTSL